MAENIYVRLWGRLYGMFGLEPSIPRRGAPVLQDSVQPVLDVSLLVGNLETVRETITNPSAGFANFLTVPSGEYWLVHAWDIIRISGGDTSLGSAILPPNLLGVRLEEHTASGDFVTGLLAHPLPVSEGTIFQFSFTGSGSTIFRVDIYRTRYRIEI